MKIMILFHRIMPQTCSLLPDITDEILVLEDPAIRPARFLHLNRFPNKVSSRLCLWPCPLLLEVTGFNVKFLSIKT